MNKAGRLAIGDEPVTDAVEVRQARVLVLASDAGDNTVRRWQRLSAEAGIACLTLNGTKAEFGAVLGRSVCSVAAVCDIGFAAKLLQLECEAHPGDTVLAQAAEAMQAKAEHLWAEQKKKRKEEEQAKKRRPVQPQKPAAEKAKPNANRSAGHRDTKPERSGNRDDRRPYKDSSSYKPKKVYGRPSGSSRQKVSIGERRKEDARRKEERTSSGTGFSPSRKNDHRGTAPARTYRQGRSPRANGGNVK